MNACANAPEIREQVVVVVDTDLPLAGGPTSTRVAAMDTLRVEVLDGATVTETRDFVLADPRDWPLSLGVVSRARLRLRLFQARLARPELTVERLVDVEVGGPGVQRLRVLLSGECLGRAIDLATRTSCIDGGRTAASPAEGLVPDDGGPSRAGTWVHAHPVPCSGPDDPTRPCVPGGFDVLGDLALAATPTRRAEPLPLRTVVVSPFRMDRTEVTVGRYLSMLRAGSLGATADRPVLADPRVQEQALCTFQGEEDRTSDALPLNCVLPSLARAVCKASGGRLPSEAEWEHAARRGDGRVFPWGNEAATCCTTSASRSPRSTIPAECPRGRVEPAGSHVAAASACPGGGDVSIDGVVDLGGSLSELTLDRFRPVSECFGTGLLFDPVCGDSGTTGPFLLKGTDWTAGLGRTRAAYRTEAIGKGWAQSSGFRCVYPEGAP